MADRAVEGAKAAARRANVRVVDVAIDDVGDDAARMLALSNGIGGDPDVEERRVFGEAYGFAGRDTLATRCALDERVGAPARRLGSVSGPERTSRRTTRCRRAFAEQS